MHFESGPHRARQVVAAALFLCAPLAAAAQSQQPSTPRLTLPPVVVTAQKEPTDIRNIPGSVTAVTADTLTDSGVRIVSDAALFAPNTFFTEFTARKASNPRFRGIGASPGNPAVTTYIDGVPQLNANSSSIELMDVDQIEFVRGPAEPALRAQRARRHHQRHQRAPVALEVDRQRGGPVRQPVVTRSARQRHRAARPTRSASASRPASRRATASPSTR